MTDVSILKEQQQDVIRQRDEFIENHKGDDEFVALIKDKAELKVNPIVIVAAISAVVMIAATYALSVFAPESSPMYMWASVGVPTAVTAAFVIFSFAKSEKYSDIYDSISRSIYANEVTVHDFNKKIDELQKLIEEGEQAEA